MMGEDLVDPGEGGGRHADTGAVLPGVIQEILLFGSDT